MEAGPRRRRLDRVTAEDFTVDLDQRPVAELRAMRDECHEEEQRLSYVRRLVQGRLDIARAEQDRRARGDEDPLDLVSLLPKILADPPVERAPAAARSVALFTPEGSFGQRTHDALLDDPVLARLPDLDDAELDALLQRLAEEERQVSGTRRTVLDHYDRVQAEIIRRYREGGANVDELLPGADRG